MSESEIAAARQDIERLKERIEKREAYFAYREGWKDGALDAPKKQTSYWYEQGYINGYNAYEAAVSYASTFTGYATILETDGGK